MLIISDFISTEMSVSSAGIKFPPEVKKLHFKGCKTICNCEFNEKLEVIEVPKGSLAHYREQFPDYQDKIIEV